MRRWLLYHIPKTGGTSISQHLQESLGQKFMSVTLEQRAGSFTSSDVRAASPSRVQGVQVFAGHGVGRFLHEVLEGSVFAEMVVLREPAARMVSHYNFVVGSPCTNRDSSLSFQSFLAQFPPDFMLRFLCTRFGLPVNARSLDRVLHNLAGMYTLTTSEVDAAIAELSRILGIHPKAARRNVSGIDFPVRLESDPALIRHLRQLNPLDVMLYEAARDMAPRSVARMRELTREDM